MMARHISRAAAELEISGPDWMEMSPAEKRAARDEAQNRRRKVDRFVAKPEEKRKGNNRPTNWTTAQWEMYKKATGKA